MPIDKLEKPRSTDVNLSSITLNIAMQRTICCSECGESQFTLRRVRDEEGKKVKPSKYICTECYRSEQAILGML